MIPAHTIQVSDEEAAVLCEALNFYLSEGPSEDDTGVDWLAYNRSSRIAEDLSRRLADAIAPLSAAA